MSKPEAQAEDNFDPFEDDAASAKEIPEAEITTAKPEAKEEGEAEEAQNQTGENEEAEGTPPEGKEGKEDANGKMIPEHRFKAALKQVTDERDFYREKATKETAIPVPDKATDPDGYELHTRMANSLELMRDMYPDYDTVIQGYAELSKVNPYLDDAVAKAKNPAKFAYDLVKRSMEMQELTGIKDSPDWKEFQEFKKTRAKDGDAEFKAADLNKTVVNGLSKVPNLNRATNVSKGGAKESSDSDDYLFGDAKF